MLYWFWLRVLVAITYCKVFLSHHMKSDIKTTFCLVTIYVFSFCSRSTVLIAVSSLKAVNKTNNGQYMCGILANSEPLKFRSKLAVFHRERYLSCDRVREIQKTAYWAEQKLRCDARCQSSSLFIKWSFPQNLLYEQMTRFTIENNYNFDNAPSFQKYNNDKNGKVDI